MHREISVKDFSGTTAPRSLKFSTYIGHDCRMIGVRDNQLLVLIIPFICPYFFVSNIFFFTGFSAQIRA